MLLILGWEMLGLVGQEVLISSGAFIKLTSLTFYISHLAFITAMDTMV